MTLIASALARWRNKVAALALCRQRHPETPITTATTCVMATSSADSSSNNAGASAAVVSTSHTSSLKVEHQPQTSFRRTKRTNYADWERVFFPRLHSPPDEEHTGPHIRSAARLTTATDTTSSSLNRSVLSRRDEAALRRTGIVLRALATPVFGRVTYLVLVAMAYVGYGVGRVSFYTRHSVAPLLPSFSTTEGAPSSSPTSASSVQRLIEIGAYEQAAAVTTTSSRSGCGNALLFRGFLHGAALDSLHVGRSMIHGRGLVTSRDIPRGTRIITEPQRTYMDATSFVPLLVDTHMRLPDTWHYTHPTGVLLELVTQPLPHHLMNHSCDPNCCSGLSREFWPAALASGRIELRERIEHFPHFDDPNSFFTTRDVPAGGELTLSYSHRVAPLFCGENPLQKFPMLVCRCGSPTCHHFVYRPADEIMRCFIGWKLRGNGGDVTENLSQLLRLGFDDETMLLSLLPSHEPLLAYMRTHLAPHRRTATKSELLLCYRHVFRLLNETAPEVPEGD